MSTIPVPPTPPLTPKMRSALYAIWAWLSLLVFLVALSYGVIVPGEEVPSTVLVVSVVLNALGSTLGFLAKNNAGPAKPPAV